MRLRRNDCDKKKKGHPANELSNGMSFDAFLSFLLM